MEIITEILPLREQIKTWQRENKNIAFVPTMGNLHEGHLTLIRTAHKNADVVVASIFVNPLQFNSSDDLALYPRTLDDDIKKLTVENVDLLFTPTPEIIYPNGLDLHTKVDVPVISTILEGESRPGHFTGVATVVAKLFNLIQPDIACFGEKDYQQLALIRQMVSDMAMDIQIVGVSTIRELDGLAMSSRNNRLTLSERQKAPALARIMHWLANQIHSGNHNYESLIKEANDQLRAAEFKPDTIYIRDAKTLQEPTEATEKQVILMSAYLGDVRLIDNHVVELNTAKEEQ